MTSPKSIITRLSTTLLCTVLGSWSLPESLHAANAIWTGAADGTWIGANWNPSVPGSNVPANSADIATFNNNVSTTVTVDATRSIGSLVFDPGAGAFTFNSGSLYFGPSTTGGSADDILMNSGVANAQVINSALAPFRVSVSVIFGFTNNSSLADLTLNGNITGNTASGATTSLLNLSGTGNGAINGVIADGTGALSLAKLGTGTWTLSRANLFTGSTTVVGGGLTLDFSGGSSPTSNIIPSTSTLSLGSNTLPGSRTLTIAGKSNTGNTQSFVSLALVGGASHINLTTAGIGSTTLNLGTTFAGASRATGVTLDISAPAGTTVTSATPNAANGALPQGTTFNGEHFAANNGSNTIIAFSAYTANTATTLGTTNQIVDMSAGNTSIATAGTTTIGGLRFNAAAPTTLTLGPARMLSFPAAGILNTANVGANLTTITGGLVSGLSTRDLIIHQNNLAGDLQIESVITNVGTNGALGLTKSGVGELILTGKNTFSAATVINEGTVTVTSDATVGNTQSLNTTAASGTITGVNTTGLFIGQRVNGANINANNAQGYYITSIDSGTNTITVSGTAITAGTADVVFGSSGGLGTFTTGANAVRIGSGATLQIGNAGLTGGLVTNQRITNDGIVAINRSNTTTFSNYIYGTGTVSQTGTGTTNMGVSQFYTGDTSVSSGILEVNSAAVIAQSGVGGTRTGSSDTITGMDAGVVSNLRVGQLFTGSGISTSSPVYITEIVDATTVKMNLVATSNNTSANMSFVAGGDLGTGTLRVTGGTLRVSASGSINTNAGVSVTGGTFRYDGTVGLNRNVTLNGGTFRQNSSNNYTGALTFISGKIGGTNLSGLNLTIGTGQTIAPGNSTGSASAGATTWANGGTFEFEINDASNVAGAGSTTAGWDLLNPTTLNITAGVGQFTINLITLTSGQVAGNADNFNSASNYSWLFVDAGASITGFNSNQFVFTDNFLNPTLTPGTSNFSVTQGVGLDDDKLFINYSAIPEPGTAVLLLAAFASSVLRRRRRA